MDFVLHYFNLNFSSKVSRFGQYEEEKHYSNQKQYIKICGPVTLRVKIAETTQYILSSSNKTMRDKTCENLTQPRSIIISHFRFLIMNRGSASGKNRKNELLRKRRDKELITYKISMKGCMKEI